VHIKTFTQRMAVCDVMENMWKVTDALRSTMSEILSNPEIKNKQTELNKAIDEFTAYLKKRVAAVDDNQVKKSDEDFFCNNNQTEGEIDMKKEELQEIMKTAIDDALKPVNDKLTAIEKLETTDEKSKGKEKTKDDLENVEKAQLEEIIKKTINEALTSTNDRISAIEKSKGISRQAVGEIQQQETVKKSIFSGFPI